MSTKNALAKAPSHLTNNRRPVGTPGAGEWVATKHGVDDSVALPCAAEIEKAERNAAWAEKNAKVSERLSQFTSPEELHEQVQRATEHFVRFYDQKRKSNHIDAQDIAQATLVEVLKIIESGKPILNLQKLAASVAANITVRATENGFRPENRRAYVLWSKKCEELQLELGRGLTQAEEDSVAEYILETWHDPRHKPTKDFRTPRTVDASIFDLGPSAPGIEWAETIAEKDDVDRYIEPDSYMDQAFNELDATGSAHKAAARRLMFNALAERTGVPMAQEGSLSQRQVTKHRTNMGAEPGSVNKAIDDWGNGMETPAVEALFAPFGELTVTQQNDVVNFLDSHSDIADDMWASAIGFANNKHSRKTTEN